MILKFYLEILFNGLFYLIIILGFVLKNNPDWLGDYRLDF